ncbi:MAG: hypothetical protein GWN85_33545, partial [Gemmatimonadetes bacterium]|nr:hypothetical protein [Gemmatimonadota bacterium]NIR40272.1 hypothetical protein [Actinomycetota bacterium]NIS35120.1 hypothetical protein [Actinomycetota bacterium]NIU69847.1 hypothetical protein [Actinomycetota bacterium]NIW31723.1 hypothetical protein [Actinomycetota bacterium]
PLPTDPLETALAWLRTQPPGIAARPADLAEFVVADRYRSRSTGITHLVLRQRIRGIEVVNGDLQINVGPDGSIVNAHDGFVRREAARADTPAITAARALEG